MCWIIDSYEHTRPLSRRIFDFDELQSFFDMPSKEKLCSLFLCDGILDLQIDDISDLNDPLTFWRFNKIFLEIGVPDVKKFNFHNYNQDDEQLTYSFDLKYV
uniref:Uncharacterized protein n=1 Tax=Pithovirus LCDPAC02 TaxID=2506601 RepID=A0A481YNI7_9VIRU|nr:MAG: hypothetical protein LCDPAC02_00920 [Pithovirus LCDPAC02]